MPDPIKKSLSKAQRITRAQLPQALEEARIAGQNLRIMRGDPARFKGVTSRLTDENKIQFYKDLLAQQTAAQKTTSSIPSSRVKKVPKEGSKKFVGPYSPAQGRGETLAGAGEEAFGERPGQWHRQAPKRRGRDIGTTLSQRLGGNPMAGKGQNVQSYLGNRQPKGAAVNDLLAAIIKLPKEVRNSILAQLADAQRQAYIPF